MHGWTACIMRGSDSQHLASLDDDTLEREHTVVRVNRAATVRCAAVDETRIANRQRVGRDAQRSTVAGAICDGDVSAPKVTSAAPLEAAGADV